MIWTLGDIFYFSTHEHCELPKGYSIVFVLAFSFYLKQSGLPARFHHPKSCVRALSQRSSLRSFINAGINTHVWSTVNVEERDCKIILGWGYLHSHCSRSREQEGFLGEAATGNQGDERATSWCLWGRFSLLIRNLTVNKTKGFPERQSRVSPDVRLKRMFLTSRVK